MQKLIVFLFAALSAFAGLIIDPATIGGIGTTTVTGSATVFYFGNTTNDPLSGSTSAEIDATTLGPVRSGFIEITGGGGGVFGGGSGGVTGYDFNCSSFCALPGSPIPEPFTLGVPFEVSVNAFASNSLGLAGSGEINFQFSLFESFILVPGVPGISPPEELPGVGASVAIVGASSVPEPATFLPVVLGLFCLVRIRASKRKPARHG